MPTVTADLSKGLWVPCGKCGRDVKQTPDRTAANGISYHLKGAVLMIDGKRQTLKESHFPKAGANSVPAGTSNDPKTAGYLQARHGHDVPAFQDRSGPVFTPAKARQVKAEAEARKQARQARKPKARKVTTKVTTKARKPKAPKAA